MAQADYVVANQTFPNTRAEINEIFHAVATNNSGDSAPSTTFANQWWYETDTNKLYIRNEDNDAFIHVLTLNQSNDTVTSVEGGATLAGIDDQSSSNDDQITITDSAVIINEDSDNLDLRVESNGNANCLFVDGGNDRVGVGTNAPAQTMHIKSTGNPSNDTGLILEGGATDSNCALYFYNSAGTEKGRFLYDTDDNILTTKVNGSEVMRIKSDGNVGIGNTNPNHGLNVGGGNINLDNDNGLYWGGSSNVRIYGNNSSHYLRFHTNGTQQWTINSDGNLQSVQSDNRIMTGASQTSTLSSLVPRTNVAGSVFSAVAGMHAHDDRDPKPADFPVGMYANFSSYAGNSSSPYADGFVMDNFGHSSGGNANILLFHKTSVEAKIAQQTTRSTSTFTSGTVSTFDLTSASDESVKEEVTTITNCLDAVSQLRPVTYKWTDEYIEAGLSRNFDENEFEENELATFYEYGDPETIGTPAVLYNEDDDIPEGKEIGDIKTPAVAPLKKDKDIKTEGTPVKRKTVTKKTNVGLIAQEVEAVIPTVVHQNRVSLDGEQSYLKNVDYDKLVPHLIGAIKELKARIETLEGE